MASTSLAPDGRTANSFRCSFLLSLLERSSAKHLDEGHESASRFNYTRASGYIWTGTQHLTVDAVRSKGESNSFCFAGSGPNRIDQQRLQLEEAITYLQHAPVSEDRRALTRIQVDALLARLALRKQMLGGFVNEQTLAQVSEERGLKEERIRERN
jgi:hypothetical protein